MKNKLGMRTIKTSIAVVIAIWLANILKLRSPSIVAAATIISVSNNMHDSVNKSINRMLSTVVGMIVAVIFQKINFVNSLSLGIGVLIIIFICNVFHWNDALILATIIFIVIMDNAFDTDKELIIYSLNRLLDTLVGALVGIIVNISFFRPKVEHFLIMSYKQTYDDILIVFRDLIATDRELDTEMLLDDLIEINKNYHNLRNEGKLRMNSHVDILSVEEINNKFRLVISLLAEYGELDVRPKLNSDNTKKLNQLYLVNLNSEVSLDNENPQENEIIYNYEIDKIIKTMHSIEENLNKFINIYGNKKHKKIRF